jgi:hypothetical protein
MGYLAISSATKKKVQTGIWILIALAISIGVGSTLFHTFATSWAKLLDVIPILLFQLSFLGFYSRKVIRMKFGYSVALMVGFFLVSNFTQQFSHLLNGSLSYAPAFFILLGLGIYHYQQKKCEPSLLLAASGVFLLALFFRTLDREICPYFLTGTHFLWHLCNGILIYLSARSLLLNWSAKTNAG